MQRPAVPPGHVPVRARASSINRTEFRRPHNRRLDLGRPVPEARIGGSDAASEIVELGAGPSRVGDRGVEMIVDNIGGGILATCVAAGPTESE